MSKYLKANMEILRNDLKSNNVVIDGSENKPVRGADPGFFLGGGALVSCSTVSLIKKALSLS